jgi:hypothetical protein
VNSVIVVHKMIVALLMHVSRFSTITQTVEAQSVQGGADVRQRQSATAVHSCFEDPR